MTLTLYDKLVDSHKVCDLPDGDMLIYVDFHIMNEYTSPQAFSGLENKGLKVWRSEAHLAVVDHVNATRSVEAPDAQSKLLINNLEENCTKHQIAFYGLGDPRQGIEHVVVPEQGLVAPGMLIACGDSHTTTYGAFGALGFGIGTSEVEHVLATQTLRYKRMKTMRVYGRRKYRARCHGKRYHNEGGTGRGRRWSQRVCRRVCRLCNFRP